MLGKIALPKHIGIIMDGNRRFAKRLMKEPWKGHEWGAKKVEDILDWCKEFGIKCVTLYSFSYENLNRPKEELDYLMKLFEHEFRAAASHPKIHKYGVRINVIGRLNVLPEGVRKAIDEACLATKDYSNFIVNFAVAYGGRQEIVDVVKKIVANGARPEDVNESLITQNMYYGGLPDPDLIIRTGGETRISNFLLWEMAYSEFYFCEKLWPEFSREDMKEAIIDFGVRQRRFGK